MSDFNKNLPGTFEDFYNVLDDFFGGRLTTGRTLISNTFKVDVKENEDEYIVEAELPGVKKEEIELDFNEDVLRISVKKEENVNEENKNFVHRERRSSSMSRSIRLIDAKNEKINAKLNDGILIVKVPKEKKESKSNKIKID